MFFLCEGESPRWMLLGSVGFGFIFGFTRLEMGLFGVQNGVCGPLRGGGFTGFERDAPPARMHGFLHNPHPSSFGVWR